MDLMSLLRYLFDHNQQVIGGLMVIILATAALLAMRMVSQEKATSGSGRTKSAAADLDLGAIETAFKRVLAAQGVGSIAASTSATSDHAVNVTSSGDTSMRDAKIQELAREIDRLTSELNAKSDGGGFGGTVNASTAGGAIDSSQLEALQEKIAELEGKLTEYEIIEDDIADLSRYKEENQELRGELDALKARVSTGGEAPLAVSAKPIAAAIEPAAVQEVNPFENLEAELASLVADAPGDFPFEAKVETPAPFGVQESAPVQPVAKAELDEATLKDFASSVDVQKSPELQGEADVESQGSSILDETTLDTEKMFEEVSTLAQSGVSADDALEGTLDTDKLLAEISSLGASASPATAAAGSAAAPQAVAVSAAPSPLPAADVVDESKFEDDLLAEFKDSNDGGQG
jgi:hypothetical protein